MKDVLDGRRLPLSLPESQAVSGGASLIDRGLESHVSVLAAFFNSIFVMMIAYNYTKRGKEASILFDTGI